MFNDFKNLSFDVTKHTIQKLKDIFDRLNLFDLEGRYTILNNKLISLDNQTKNLDDRVSITVQEPPPTEPIPELLLTLELVITYFPTYIRFNWTVTNNKLYSPGWVTLTVAHYKFVPPNPPPGFTTVFFSTYPSGEPFLINPGESIIFQYYCNYTSNNIFLYEIWASCYGVVAISENWQDTWGIGPYYNAQPNFSGFETSHKEISFINYEV